MGERRGTKGLELWCRRMTDGYTGVEINNMTTSWRDGLGFCAIIHHFRPDLIDFAKLNKEDIYYNNDLAFQTAERHLGIPALLEPEDMVEYPVPDRLSILTYLSQYYQTFVVAQGSPSRIVPKRPSNASVGGVVSPSSTSPSAKIPRPSGGVGRRDPCAKCGLPVFIAERLNVGKQLYHRTCFRCARCNSQLTLANYYETETENQYCCEICPDEEVASVKEHEKSVLTRSLSDEEKSSDLQQFDDHDDYSSMFESALEKQSDCSVMERSSEFSEARSSFFTSQLDDEADDKIPDLPKSDPPIVPKSEPPDLQRSDETPVTVDRAKDLSNDSNSIISAPFDSYDSGYPSVNQSLDSYVHNSVSEDFDKNQPQTANEPLDFNSTKETNESSTRTSLVKARALLFENKCLDDVQTKLPQKSLPEVPLGSRINECVDINDSVSVSSNLKVSSSIKNNEEVIEEMPLEIEHDLKDNQKDDVEYPEDLNPFGDDDSDHGNPFGEESAKREDTPKPAARKKLASRNNQLEQKSYNPFDDDEDEITEEVTLRKVPVLTITTDPFGSDDDEQTKIQKPVPLPRNARSLVNTPEPKPRKSTVGGHLHKEMFGSNSSLNSAHSSIGTARKKKPAPRPPTLDRQDSPHSSLTSSPSVSVQHSPKSTPRLRRKNKAPLPPSQTSTPCTSIPNTRYTCSTLSPTHWDEEKIIKDEVNRNRQSQIITSDSESPNNEDFATPNKSMYGKWKRRKGPAPCRPIPQRRHIKPLPTAEIKRELDFIEIQQQGLEKQGVKLEQIIREKCEGPNVSANTALSPEVEDLILQLFELVNEKNDLFRKQAELMYLRRQQRLEEEYADLEYQIRCLMLQPEANKTDSDKAREEELINRLVEVVERRNEIVECLEMDRIREAEEDDSINNQLNLYTLKRDEITAMSIKEDMKRKKKKKEKRFKLRTSKKADADKDIDESESSAATSEQKEKKKKKFNIF